MASEYKIGELKGETRDGSFRVVRMTARGRKTVVKTDADAEEFSLPEAWLAACEEWLNLVGRQGWMLCSAETLAEPHVRYVLRREAGGGSGKGAKQKSLTDELTEQVAGKAVRSVLKIP